MATNGGGKGRSGKGRKTPSGMSVGAQDSVSSTDDRKTRRAEAVATMKREQARRETRSRLLMASGVVAAVLVVVAVGVYVGVTRPSPASASGREDASAAVVAHVTSVPATVFDKVGAGTTIGSPTKTGVTTVLKVHGLPHFLYVGAEYCPYCAAERWAMAASLSRFGTFTGLKETESSATDVFPKTQTLSFYGAKYTSTYVDFKAIETADNAGKPLETLAGDDKTIEAKYNHPPYVSGQGGSIPFVDIANEYVSSGATLDAAVLKGKSHAEIAQDMQDPSSDVGKAVDGAANLFSAAICQTTGGQPSTVCASSGVQAATTALASAKSSGSNSSSSGG